VGVERQDLVAVTRRLSSAVRIKLSKPRRALLCGYCAMVRTPLRSPTTDVAVLPTFKPPPRQLACWHFFLLAPQASVPISALGRGPQMIRSEAGSPQRLLPLALIDGKTSPLAARAVSVYAAAKPCDQGYHAMKPSRTPRLVFRVNSSVSTCSR
jgi:hypothetical protein